MAVCFICFLLFFIFPDISKQGVEDGIRLLAFQLIPSLYPFLLLSSIVRLMDIPAGLSRIYPVIFGFVSGYPTGAKAVADMNAAGKIEKKKAETLLVLVSNPSPAFMISYAAMGMLGDAALGPLMWVAALSGSFLAYAVLLLSRRSASTENRVLAASSIPCSTRPSGFFDRIGAASSDTFAILISICETVLIFSVVTAFLDAAAFLPPVIRLLLSGLMEMTCGISRMAASDLPDVAKICLITFFAAFGGLSTAAQTAPILRARSFSIKKYITGKALAACLALPVILCLLYVFRPSCF